MNVYAFHQNITEYGDYYFGLTELWAENWKKNGFNPVIFTWDEINTHPRCKEFYDKISEYKSSNLKQYQEGNLMRWLGYAICLERYGEGFTVDTDVFNFGLRPEYIWFDKSKLTAFAKLWKSPPMSVYANKENINSILDIIYNYKGEGITVSGMQQISDMIIFYENDSLFHCLNYECLFNNPGWKKYPLIHFANDCIVRYQGEKPENKSEFIKQFLKP